MARTTGAPVISTPPFGAAAGGKGASSGGEREFVPVLARAAVRSASRRVHRNPS